MVHPESTINIKVIKNHKNYYYMHEGLPQLETLNCNIEQTLDEYGYKPNVTASNLTFMFLTINVLLITIR